MTEYKTRGIMRGARVGLAGLLTGAVVGAGVLFGAGGAYGQDISTSFEIMSENTVLSTTPKERRELKAYGAYFKGLEQMEYRNKENLRNIEIQKKLDYQSRLLERANNASDGNNQRDVKMLDEASIGSAINEMADIKYPKSLAKTSSQVTIYGSSSSQSAPAEIKKVPEYREMLSSDDEICNFARDHITYRNNAAGEYRVMKKVLLDRKISEDDAEISAGPEGLKAYFNGHYGHYIVSETGNAK